VAVGAKRRGRFGERSGVEEEEEIAVMRGGKQVLYT